MTAIQDPFQGGQMAQFGHFVHSANRMHRQLWTLHISSEITYTQFEVMTVIAANPAVDQNTVARLVLLDSSTTTDVVRRLIERGYVERTRDTVDMRRKTLVLTTSGARKQGLLAHADQKLSESLAACLTAVERVDILRILQRITTIGSTLRHGWSADLTE
ncbi:MarR family winged helix-turn-helix transcriptional regulator [Nocardia salmonicida]|uniref:MarR family winged helix-turn-helix transcriptional regulator n=1 Tax=Nocardia salmonicida TaxID=53431 RepID=UPI00366B1A78